MATLTGEIDDQVIVERLAEALAVMRADGRIIGDLDRQRCRAEARLTLRRLRRTIRC